LENTYEKISNYGPAVHGCRHKRQARKLKNVAQFKARLAHMAADSAAYAGCPMHIVFRTNRPGVYMPAYLREQYPDQMTFVLENQYRDLAPARTSFHVDLCFSGKWASLTVPYREMIQVSQANPLAALAATQDTTGQVVSLAAFRKKKNG
jgi:hypothetical protein